MDLIASDGHFTPQEQKVALELIDGAIADPEGEYRLAVAEVDDRIGAYACFGPTPMTAGTWDLYWIVTHAALRGHGLASAILSFMEERLRELGAGHVRVETSSTEMYGSAHRFYERHGYPEAARLPDFYKPGDALIILYKRL